MTFGAVDIPIRGVDDFREALKGHELRLAAARKQRDVIRGSFVLTKFEHSQKRCLQPRFPRFCSQPSMI
jgi:hypothetical protein